MLLRTMPEPSTTEGRCIQGEVPAGGQGTQLEQLREMQAKLNEEAGRLVQL